MVWTCRFDFAVW